MILNYCRKISTYAHLSLRNKWAERYMDKQISHSAFADDHCTFRWLKTSWMAGREVSVLSRLDQCSLDCYGHCPRGAYHLWRGGSFKYYAPYYTCTPHLPCRGRGGEGAPSCDMFPSLPIVP